MKKFQMQKFIRKINIEIKYLFHMDENFQTEKNHPNVDENFQIVKFHPN